MKLLNGGGIAVLRKQLAEIDKLMKNGIQKDAGTGLAYFTGYSYNTLYDWDQYFEALTQIYMGWESKYIKNGVLIFLANQHADGFIPRHIPVSDCYSPQEHVKPFLCQIAMLVIDNYGETEWILQDKHIGRLKKYVDYWLNDMDKDKNGLSEWLSAPHTGMDNQHERAGYWGDGFCEGVDLNCYIAAETAAFSKILKLYGDNAAAAEYEKISKKRAETVRKLLWNEEDGIFYDRNIYFNNPGARSPKLPWAAAANGFPDTEAIRVKSISCFAPLACGVATDEQAKRLVFEHLLNTDEFWSVFPVRTLAKSERWYSQIPLPSDLGCNWRATTWIPTNYMLVHGLKEYGYNDAAAAIRWNTERLVKKAGNREYYATDTGAGLGLDPFWGWSLLAHFMKYEEDNRIINPLLKKS